MYYLLHTKLAEVLVLGVNQVVQLMHRQLHQERGFEIKVQQQKHRYCLSCMYHTCHVSCSVPGAFVCPGSPVRASPKPPQSFKECMQQVEASRTALDLSLFSYASSWTEHHVSALCFFFGYDVTWDKDEQACRSFTPTIAMDPVFFFFVFFGCVLRGGAWPLYIVVQDFVVWCLGSSACFRSLL